jgi:hypothetical protein
VNERIKELGRQAGFAFIEDGVYGQRWYSSKCGMDKLEFEKFAELIVEECVKLCRHEANDDEYDQYDMGMSVKAENIKTAIKQHFGVES